MTETRTRTLYEQAGRAVHTFTRDVWDHLPEMAEWSPSGMRARSARRRMGDMWNQARADWTAGRRTHAANTMVRLAQLCDGLRRQIDRQPASYQLRRAWSAWRNGAAIVAALALFDGLMAATRETLTRGVRAATRVASSYGKGVGIALALGVGAFVMMRGRR